MNLRDPGKPVMSLPVLDPIVDEDNIPDMHIALLSGPLLIGQQGWQDLDMLGIPPAGSSVLHKFESA